jgi:tetratricopeptide (TPR) repeat protein
MRNRGSVLAASLVLLVLLGGILGTTWGMIGAEQARQEAQRRLAQLEHGTDILASVFRDLDPMTAEREGAALRVLLTRRLAEAAQQLDGETVGDPLVVARLQDVLGTSLYEMGELEQAERVLVKSCSTREQLLEAGHLDTAATQHHLAMVYRQQRKYALAEPLYQAALAVRSAKLGADHADTLATQHHLAILYHAEQKFDLAETLYKEVAATRTLKLGAEHRDTLATQHRLAWLYRCQGNYDLAEKLFKEVLALRTAKLGPDDLDTAATKHNLAALYLLQRKDALAEPLFQEALAVRNAKLGADHLDTLTSQAYLAALCNNQGKRDLAEVLFKEVLARRTIKLGRDDPLTLGSQDGLATVYRDQGKFAPAEALYKEALALRTAKQGADHADAIASRDYLARLYSKRFMNRLDLEIPLREQALKLKKTKFPPEHLELLYRQVHLGVLYCDAGRFAEAEPLLLQSYEAMKKREAEIAAHDRFHVTEALESLVRLYEARDQADEAARWRKELQAWPTK